MPTCRHKGGQEGDAPKALDKCLRALIRGGHAQAWDYGWSFLQEALNELTESIGKGGGHGKG